MIQKQKNIKMNMQMPYFKQYEISSFGKVSIHNSSYWMLDNYIGVGCGAVGFLDNKRLYPPKRLKEYIKEPLNIEIEKLST